MPLGSCSLILYSVLVLQTLTGFNAKGPCDELGLCGCEPNDLRTRQVSIKLWPGGLVFYKLDKAFTEGFVTKFKSRIRYLEKIVGPQHFQFVEAISPSGTLCRKSYISVQRTMGEVCAFETGMKTDGPTIFEFNEKKCSDKQILVGLLSAIGLTWENSRPDREKFIKFHPQNLNSFVCRSYEVRPDNSFGGMEYDTDSFFHHSSCEFSCNGKYVVTKMDGSPIQPKKYLSSKDIDKLRRLYPSENQVQFIQDKYCLDVPRGTS